MSPTGGDAWEAKGLAEYHEFAGIMALGRFEATRIIDGRTESDIRIFVLSRKLSLQALLETVRIACGSFEPSPSSGTSGGRRITATSSGIPARGATGETEDGRRSLAQVHQGDGPHNPPPSRLPRLGQASEDGSVRMALPDPMINVQDLTHSTHKKWLAVTNANSRAAHRGPRAQPFPEMIVAPRSRSMW